MSKKISDDEKRELLRIIISEKKDGLMPPLAEIDRKYPGVANRFYYCGVEINNEKITSYIELCKKMGYELRDKNLTGKTYWNFEKGQKALLSESKDGISLSHIGLRKKHGGLVGAIYRGGIEAPDGELIKTLPRFREKIGLKKPSISYINVTADECLDAIILESNDGVAMSSGEFEKIHPNEFYTIRKGMIKDAEGNKLNYTQLAESLSLIDSRKYNFIVDIIVDNVFRGPILIEEIIKAEDLNRFKTMCNIKDLQIVGELKVAYTHKKQNPIIYRPGQEDRLAHYVINNIDKLGPKKSTHIKSYFTGLPDKTISILKLHLSKPIKNKIRKNIKPVVKDNLISISNIGDTRFLLIEADYVIHKNVDKKASYILTVSGRDYLKNVIGFNLVDKISEF
jgi:hypothetical protein